MPLCTPFELVGDALPESRDVRLVALPLRPSSSEVREVEASEEDLECAMSVCVGCSRRQHCDFPAMMCQFRKGMLFSQLYLASRRVQTLTWKSATMFANTVQSSLLSLFSSTGSDPLQLFSQQVDKDLPEDSFIHWLNDTTNDPAPAPPRKLIHSTSAQGDSDNGNATRRTTLCQTVLHIQSPTIRSTFVRCPALSDLSGGTRRSTLGLKHPWVHLQVRNLEHEWAFEIGVVDTLKSPGIMRFSTFQVSFDLF